MRASSGSRYDAIETKMRFFTAHRFRRGAWRRFALACGAARETRVTIGMFVEMIVAVVVEPPPLIVVVVRVGMMVGCRVGRIVLIVLCRALELACPTARGSSILHRVGARLLLEDKAKGRHPGAPRRSTRG